MSEHPTVERSTRRHFLGKTAAALAALSIVPPSGRSEPSPSPAEPRQEFPDGAPIVLFQGDSITDAGRDGTREGNANDTRAMGHGYAFLVASYFLAERPDKRLEFYNRGISGNKVFQLAERWDKDCLALKPDVVSILIGVNDIWHTLNGTYNGTVEVYEKDYRALIERTQRELPDVELILCEPFVLRCGAVNDKWFPEFDLYRAAARRVATDAGALFVPFQSMFDEAVKAAPPAHWAADGVHPTMAGSCRMARAWLEAVSRANG